MNEYMKTQESRFCEPFEIIEMTSKVNLNKNCLVGGVPVISDGENMYIDSSEANSIIISDPGSGKTRRVCAPLILSCANSSSMVINDPKQELFKMTHSYLKEKGFTVYRLNLRDPESGGDTYNPLLYPASLYKAGKNKHAVEEFMQIAESIYSEVYSASDPFWHTMAQQLFCAYCLIACREIDSPEEMTFSYVYRLFLEGEEKIGGNTVLKEYLRFIDDSIIYEAIAGYINSPSETRASILAVFSSVLSKLVVGGNISHLIEGNSFEPEVLVTEKVALFITPRDEVGVYNSILSSIIDQIYKRLLIEAEKTNGVLKRRCEFIIDEFSNLAPIISFTNKISEARSRNIRFHLFIQSYDQMVAKYGKEDASVICACCQNTFYMHSPERTILENISERCGTYISEYTNQDHHLLSVSALQHFRKDKGEMLVLLGRLYPYVTYLPDFEVYVKKLGIKESSLSICAKRTKKRTVSKKQLFSMKEFVQKRREEDMEKLLNKSNSHMGTYDLPSVSNKPFGELDIKRIEARIDQKLKELEEMPDF